MTLFCLGMLFGALLLKLAMMFYGVDDDYARIQFLVDVTNDGYAPAVLFDDDGNWAISFDGWHVGDQITCIVEPDSWKPSLREAIDDAQMKLESSNAGT